MYASYFPWFFTEVVSFFKKAYRLTNLVNVQVLAWRHAQMRFVPWPIRLFNHPAHGDRLVLVEMPALDNTIKSDLEILGIISRWLQKV